MRKSDSGPGLIESWVLEQPEVFGSMASVSSRVRGAVEAGLLRKIAPRLYTRNLTDTPEAVIRRHFWDVISLVVPEGCVVGFRTAFEHRPMDGHVWVSGPYARNFTLPGLHIHLTEGPGPLDGDKPYVGMHLASEPRALLENLMPTRTRGGVRRAVSRTTIEERLETILQSRGEAGLQAVRDAARALAPALGAEEAFADLHALIGATLGSRPNLKARSRVLRARMRGAPYDQGAVERVDLLRRELEVSPTNRPDAAVDGAAWDTIAFFDAYFSNYIEGTEFEVDEAEAIIFGNEIPKARPADAHDILGTYRLVASHEAMSLAPSAVGSYEQFEGLLERWHVTLMAGRPEIGPGEWKTDGNRAGETEFVPPELARGTMRAGFDHVRTLPTPFARAAALMFLVTEVHPFRDGNGRLARAVMNAELIAGGQRRILIPTVYRNDYIGALRLLSRQNLATVIPKMLEVAQAFTAAVQFDDREKARKQLEQHNAFKDSNEGRLLVHAPEHTPKRH